ncbi:hypothetical protein U5801_20540 [Lamprobacter modestohalophilus]|uniref:hypothetical protein n=1 Tax=Lamprobacter modestohalophilus TaxID=1064514 RepID=UPI002ADECBB5|nr:hypothetical protein [Lamprobacter modestohalophilus]MEA1052177.1 hypothetical protein [Lamprobacter modestohalophilus]
MKISDLVRFNDERFFDGAVQLRWVQERPEQAREAATAFVFHGPRYHGASDARQDGIDGGYRLKDTASLVADLLASLLAGQRGEERNPFWLAVAGYGAGKSHLSTAIACLLSAPTDATAAQIIANVQQADAEIGATLARSVSELSKPALVLCLDGMAGFHLGNALSQAVFAQLQRYGVDAGAIRELSPRFQTAEQFVQRNLGIRAEAFGKRLPGLDGDAICARLRHHDEAIYTEVDALYAEANGVPIPVTGQESAQELIQTLCEVYCGEDGAFSGVVILFDEFGRYLEYAAEKPQLAGDSALQQLFQGVQDHSGKVRFVGLIQYELKAYLKRFSSADLRQLQRYITRFDAAEKLYLSTNLETIFAHMIGKDEAGMAAVWEQTGAERQQQLTWQRLSRALPEFARFPVWSDAERCSRVIAQGCWPLHPLATWFLTRQRDLVQSRSALTFIKDVVERIGDEEAVSAARLRQVSAAELVLRSMLPEMIAAEQQTGGTVAETLQLLLEKFQGHLSDAERLLLAGVAALEKMRVGKQAQLDAGQLLAEATALDPETLHTALQRLSVDLGALEWNADLGQYELIADASTRGQFQQWLRQRQITITAEMVRDLFVGRGAADSEIGNIETGFGSSRQIATPDWFFEAQCAHIHSLETAVKTAFEDWRQAMLPKDAKGRVIYLYLHAEDDPAAIDQRLSAVFAEALAQIGQAAAPIWVVGIADRTGAIANHLGRLYLFDEQLTTEERERFRRFVPEEQERSKRALKEAVEEGIKERLYWVAGISDVPTGRLARVGEQLFARVYPRALPFPFDGFTTSSGGGAADATQLARSLMMRQIDGNWVPAQPRRLQNRVAEVLVRSWRVLTSAGKLTEPQNPEVKLAFDWLKQVHSDDPGRSLWVSYQALMAPPYGLNASSAAVLLGLLIGGEHPPRRIEHGGQMVAAMDWVSSAFPAQRGKHFLDALILRKTTLRFLSEDSAGRWRALLERWETEERYQTLVELDREAQQLQKAEPVPEVLEGRLKYLQDKSEKAAIQLREFRAKLVEWEQGIERAERQNKVGELLRISTLLFRQRRQVEDGSCWPKPFGNDCEQLLAIGREMVSERVGDWIPRQGCQSPAEVGSFRQRMEKAISSLKDLGFETEAKALEQQAQRSIMQVEQRQKYILILNESDDYPRQTEPNSSTPVRELRDGIAKGDALIEGIKKTQSVLGEAEINARIKAIEHRQQQLRKVLDDQNKQLSAVYSLSLQSEEAVREAMVQVNRLRNIFVETPDLNDINDLAVQLQRVIADSAAWTADDVSPERQQELLQQQISDQLAKLTEDFEQQEIEPAWEMAALYQALAKERVEATQRRSEDWIKPRQQLTSTIAKATAADCDRIEKELAAAPGYLADAHREQVEALRETLELRRQALDNEARLGRLAKWRSQFPATEDIGNLSKPETEFLLKALESPPDSLTAAESAELAPITNALAAHYDQMSMDDIVARIRRLSQERRRELMALLTAEI